MAALTWRNVDAPNFSGAIDGVRTASMLLNNAVDAGRQGLRDYRRDQERDADRQLLSYVQGIQDPTAMQNALASDPRLAQLRQNASIDTIRQLDARPGALIERALAGENLANETLKGSQYRSGVEAMNANGDTINQANLAAQRGDLAGANAALGELGSMRPDLLARILGTNSEVGLNSLRNQQSALNVENTRDEAQDSRVAQAVSQNILMNSSGDPSDVRSVLDGLGLPPNVKAKVINQLSANGYTGLYAPFGSGSGGGGGGGGGSVSGGGARGSYSSGLVYDAPQQSVANVLSSAGLPSNVVAGFLGNFHVENGYTGKKGDGESAAGIAQWRGPRRENFQKVMGKPVEEATPEEQAKYVLWEMQNPTHPSVGMSVAQRDRILAAGSAGEAAELIDQIYERSNGQHRSRRVAAANDAATALGTAPTGDDIRAAAENRASTLLEGALVRDSAKVARAQLTSNNTSVRLREIAANFPDDAGLAVDKIIAGGRGFTEADRGTLLKKIGQLTRMNPDLPVSGAAAIITQSTDERDNWLQSGYRHIGLLWGDDTTTNLSNIKIKDYVANQAAKDFSTGKAWDNYDATRQLELQIQVNEQLEQVWQAAQQQYLNYAQYARGRPGTEGRLNLLKKEADLAKNAYDASTEKIRNNPSMQMTRERTEQQPTPVATTVAGQSDGQAQSGYDEQFQTLIGAYRDRARERQGR